MDLTLHLRSWHLPLAITVVGIIISALICRAEAKECRAEAKECGDFSIPLLSMIAVITTIISSIVAWGMWAIMHFAHLT